MDDCKIIDLFNERSEKAISAISRKYGRTSLKIAENILKSKEDAEECVNDAYLALWNKIPPERPSPLSSYLFKVVRNISLKRYHKNAAQKRNSFYDKALEELENVLFADVSAEHELIAKDIAEAVNRFLGKLPENDRIMFVRRYFYGDGVKEIAALSDMSPHYITVRLSRIREKLKTELIKEELI
ncbi:MAG: sigma-70 family RNA polymerase sigma factor [Clostridia bacterium]|nr:sigma-70 family RNA polymerase sigma factor [Clostridia bacterium]